MRLVGQDEESRLEGILGVVAMTQHAVADAQNHRTMPAHQRRERRLFASTNKPLQQFSIGQGVERRRARISAGKTYRVG